MFPITRWWRQRSHNPNDDTVRVSRLVTTYVRSGGIRERNDTLRLAPDATGTLRTTLKVSRTKGRKAMRVLRYEIRSDAGDDPVIGVRNRHVWQGDVYVGPEVSAPTLSPSAYGFGAGKAVYMHVLRGKRRVKTVRLPAGQRDAYPCGYAERLNVRWGRSPKTGRYKAVFTLRKRYSRKAKVRMTTRFRVRYTSEAVQG
ncbi:MAG: hypothetical protein M0P31_08375 [Solirubrobacteraceae bacterium]|nr:hypothetical protein [Solirubrobacteraceae bacterium]